MFLDIYEISYGFYEQSGGAFDVSCGPLFDVWGFGFTGESAPSEEKISQAAARCGMFRLRRDIRSALAPDGSLCASDLLLSPGEPPVLNFNAIAQGYSCDTVASYLRSIGVHDMLVDIGEIYCEGLNPSRAPWSIGIDTPTDGNNTPGADMQGIWRSSGSYGQGVVTSGNYRKFYVWQGKKAAHTIDPRTSRPVTHNLLSATVVAPDATTADAVATWCMVVGAERSVELVAAMGLEACLICGADSSMTVTSTPGFNITALN